MSEQEKLNAKEQAEQDLYLQAASWVERLASGELDSLSKRRFSNWLEADARHPVLLQSMVETWQDPALTKALAAYQPSPLKRVLPQRPKLQMTAVAMAFSSVLLMLFYFGDSSLFSGPAPYELKTAQANSMQQGLDDGSVVDIAPDSQLTVFFTADKRQVLQGQGAAYFAVAKDKQRPFEVRLDQASVVAVGTEFNIDRDPDLIDITVYEGAVQVQATAAGPSVLLKSGERIRIQQHKLSEVQKVDLQQLVDWRSGWIEIENETLAYLLHRLNRSAVVPVSASAEVADLRVAGRFELANTQQTLSALSEAYGLTLEQNSSGIRLSRSPSQLQ
ncbi:FecR domain-containing protein [Rheinheimera sp. 1928-s]|uniref:FecR family protein n=1 Tax=Rheinheimera sp. 1928-s TaxID=3033803 RepID=UPI00260C2B5F|nr:FecR domain-containing protein [Rheinheimera sp. 1928-s]MDF3123650.1 FecR domain-containing protein [Rheinheimera sp. 1928-s]